MNWRIEYFGYRICSIASLIIAGIVLFILEDRCDSVMDCLIVYSAAFGCVHFAYASVVWVIEIVCWLFGIEPVDDDADADDTYPDMNEIVSSYSTVQFFYGEYVNGIARVTRVLSGDGDKCTFSYSFIDENGDPITGEYYDEAGDFEENVSAPVYKCGMYNLLGRDGVLLCSEWYCGMSNCYDGKYKVSDKDGKVNYLRVDGTLCWAEWKEECN